MNGNLAIEQLGEVLFEIFRKPNFIHMKKNFDESKKPLQNEIKHKNDIAGVRLSSTTCDLLDLAPGFIAGRPSAPPR